MSNPVFEFEYIDAVELGLRLGLPTSWIYDQSRTRTVDRIPTHKFGKYSRFAWGSEELAAWIERRLKDSR